MELQSQFYSEHGRVLLMLFSDKQTAPKTEQSVLVAVT